MATICWASTSSGSRGTRVSSIAPVRIRETTAAHSSRSPRYLGKMRPRLGASTWCPARPMRCMPRATLRGLSTWITRSTAPMSMPSSRLLVATSAGSSPALSCSSIRTRCSRARLPWWARATSSSASSFSRRARRSARRRLLTKISVERCAFTSSSSSGYIAGQIERVRASPSTSSATSGSSGGAPVPSSRMSSTGTITRRSSSLAAPASTIVTGRGRPSSSWPPRKRAISDSGRWVADRPMRCSVPPSSATSRSSRSRLRARWVPRLVPATAWISSTITERTPARTSRPREVSSRKRLSGVVMSTSGGVRSIALAVALGRVAGADGHRHLGRHDSRPLGGRGDAGQRPAQVALDVVVQRLQGGEVEHPAGRPALQAARHQPVQGPEEGGERLARIPWAPG